MMSDYNDYEYFQLSPEEVEFLELMVELGYADKTYNENTGVDMYDVHKEGYEYLVNLILKYTGRLN